MARVVERFETSGEGREDGFRYRAPIETEELHRETETVELKDGRRATRTREWGVRRFGRYVPVRERRGPLAVAGDVLLAAFGLFVLLVGCSLGYTLAGWWGVVLVVLLFAGLGAA